MLSLNRVTLIRTALIAAVCSSCLVTDAGAQPPKTGGKTVKAPAVREVKPVALATFRLANGNEVRILSAPEVDEVVVSEIINAGPNEQFTIDPKASLAEIFQRLAPKDSPVPRKIAELDAKKKLAGRPLTEALEKTIDVPANVIAAPPAPQAASGAGSCQPGAAGAAFFESHHCSSLGGPGYGKKESYCDKNSADSIQRTSDSRRRVTWSAMASCGSGMNRMRHFFSRVSGWDTQVNVYADPQKIVKWWSYTKGVKRFRRARYEEHQPGGWVRALTVFWSEVAGGW